MVQIVKTDKGIEVWYNEQRKDTFPIWMKDKIYNKFGLVNNEEGKQMEQIIEQANEPLTMEQIEALLATPTGEVLISTDGEDEADEDRVLN